MPDYDEVYFETLTDFQNRVAARDVLRQIDQPSEDNDIIETAMRAGLDEVDILKACVVARYRVSNVSGIPVHKTDSAAIAEIGRHKLNLN